MRYPNEGIFTGPQGKNHIQGIAVDEVNGYIYCSFTTRLIKLDRHGALIGSVEGLAGHLGCIAFRPADGCVYGSLEFKKDAIGANILKSLGDTGAYEDGFYVAVFNGAKITAPHMSAETDGVMTAVYLPEVYADYAGAGEPAGGAPAKHRYGCSGIDGLCFAPAPGDPDGKRLLWVAYGVYADVARTDNDHQVLLCCDPAALRANEAPLLQKEMHRRPPEAPMRKYFVYTGNTTYGVQNLEYEPRCRMLLMSVYNGKKPAFVNYGLFAADLSKPAIETPLAGLSETGMALTLWGAPVPESADITGWHASVGQCGMHRLQNGDYLIAEPATVNGENAAYLRVYTFDPQRSFVPVPELRQEIRVLEGARTILQNPDGAFNYFGWPSVARLQNGSLAVTCSGFRKAHVCPYGKAVMMTSADEGRTYTPARVIIETPLDDRDAGVVTFGETGVIVTSFNNTRAAQRGWNPDNAEFMAYVDTVTDEDEARYLGSTFRLSFDCGKTFGDIFISPVTSPHGPTVLSDGTMLWVGRTFAEDDVFRENNRIEAWRVNLDGTMGFVGAVPPVYREGTLINACEPSCIQLPDGTLLCHFRAESGLFTVFQTCSADGGKTWSAPVQLLSDRGGSPPQLYLHSSGVLISVYGYRCAPYGVRAMLSADQGKTWKTDLVLWDAGVSSDLGYPASVELNDGSLLTVFYAKDAPEGPAVIKQIRWKLV